MGQDNGQAVYDPSRRLAESRYHTMKIKHTLLALCLIAAASAAPAAESYSNIKTLDIKTFGATAADFIFLGVIASESDAFLLRLPSEVQESFKPVLRSGDVILYTVGHEIIAIRDDLSDQELSVFLDGFSQRQKPFDPMTAKFYRIARPTGKISYYIKGAVIYGQQPTSSPETPAPR